MKYEDRVCVSPRRMSHTLVRNTRAYVHQIRAPRQVISVNRSKSRVNVSGRARVSGLGHSFKLMPRNLPANLISIYGASERLGELLGELSSAHVKVAKRFLGTADWLRGTIDAAIPRNSPDRLIIIGKYLFATRINN